MRAVDERVEPDAMIVSPKTAVIVGHYLMRSSARVYLPWNRAVEYASKYAQPRPPLDLARIPAGKPFDHLYDGALDNGARRVFAETFSDNPEVAMHAIESGRAVYLLFDTRGGDPALPPMLRADEILNVGPFRLRKILEAGKG